MMSKGGARGGSVMAAGIVADVAERVAVGCWIWKLMNSSVDHANKQRARKALHCSISQ